MIRRYQSDDGDRVLEIHTESIRKIAATDYSPAEIEAWSDVDKTGLEPDEREIRFVHEKNNTVTGFGSYKPEEKEISGLYVHPDHTGEGIGRLLLEAIENDARNRDIDQLWCNSTITAKEFYQDHCWTVEDQEIYEIEEQELAVYRMKKKL